jgi:hypothetical protein
VVLAVVGCCFGRLLLRVGVAGRGLVVVVVGVRVVVVAAAWRADDWVVGVVVLLLLDERGLLAGVLFCLLWSLCAVVCGVMYTGCCVLTRCVKGQRDERAECRAQTEVGTRE